MKERLLKTGKWTLLLCCILTCSCKEQQQQKPTPTYEAMTIEHTNRDLTRKYTATIKGRQDISIYPHIAGFITELSVNEGSTVKKGDKLFVIDQVPYIAALNTAKANIEVSKANVATAELTYKSKKQLFANNVISEFDKQLAKNKLLTAKAMLAQADAALINAENNLSYTVIKAPCNGVVGTLPYRVGSLVSAAIPKPLTTVSDNSEMYVYFSMTEKQLLGMVREYKSIDSALVKMPAIELFLNDGSLYEQKGKIESISGIIDQGTGSVSLRAAFTNEGRLLHSGGAGVINIPYTKDKCIVIPQNATFEIQDKVFVYKIVDGVAKATMITVFPDHDGKEYIVESGLNVGESVLLDGIITMRDGTPVKVKSVQPNLEK